MRIARVGVDDSVHLARIDEGGHAVLLHEESHHPAADAFREAIAAGVPLDGGGVGVTRDYRLLAPITNPSKFFGVGLNYHDHAREGGFEIPDKPIFFLKTPNAIIGPTDHIRFDSDVTTEVDFEVELAIVIGRSVSGGGASAARNAIFGYTVCNDVTARDAQFSDGQWPRSKCFDTFAPLGPWIVTADSIDTSSLRLRSVVSGERMQDGNTSDLVFGPVEIITYLARSITLEPGDVITTGTPAGVGFTRNPPRFLEDGDVVEVRVDGIGSCANPVSSFRGSEGRR